MCTTDLYLPGLTSGLSHWLNTVHCGVSTSFHSQLCLSIDPSLHFTHTHSYYTTTVDLSHWLNTVHCGVITSFHSQHCLSIDPSLHFTHHPFILHHYSIPYTGITFINRLYRSHKFTISLFHCFSIGCYNTPLSYFLFQPVDHNWYVLFCLWNGACKRSLAANQKE